MVFTESLESVEGKRPGLGECKGIPGQGEDEIKGREEQRSRRHKRDRIKGRG